MFVKNENFMFGCVCYVPDNKVGKMQPIPTCTIIAALDEGNAVEQVAEQYDLSIHDILLVISYVQQNGTT